MHDPTTTTAVTDWEYVSEGGATMVFSYTGPKHPVFSRMVLRLRKVELGEHGPFESATMEDEPDDPSIEFQNAVMVPLIPAEYLPRLEPVHVNHQWLKELALHAENCRPENRRLRSAIDLSRSKAVLATDLVGGRGWAVEIKPKWAFLPNPAYLSPETKDIKLRNCRFCMHSRQRNAEGDMTATGYCPLDLFSGDKDRILKALASLWDSWIQTEGHINNLKIFVGGHTIEPKDIQDRLAPALCIPSSCSMSEALVAFQKALLPLIMDTKLLSTLRDLQRTLDPLDIEGLQHFWSKFSLSQTSMGIDFSDPSIDEWVSFVEDFVSGSKIRLQSFLDDEMDEPTLRFYIMEYLIGATFKDCSVILRLGAKDVDDSITIIDLDPKKVARLALWEKQDREIALGFQDALRKGDIEVGPCLDNRR